ncbi:unnamed protein product [Onchocerca flexuosa]|uniref:Uncharacterized protein n=1 Tax=Onchocerca flexuosa TaxID=387005 RepID=A0A183HV26_9BILA|nr:unnamed protein product [Onchocerca flexuosa]
MLVPRITVLLKITADPQGWGIVNISNGTDYHERFNIDDSEIQHFKITHFEIENFHRFISIAAQVIFFH